MIKSDELYLRLGKNSFSVVVYLISILGLIVLGIQNSSAYNEPESSRSMAYTKTYEEIIVTSQKREQKLIDVPMSVSVLGEDMIDRSSIQSLTDLSFLVPGLSVLDEEVGRQVISIRGVNNIVGGHSANTALYLDEVPLSVSPDLSAGLQTIDIERVEVLKGPQGTLFGQAGSAGAIRYIAKNPSFSNVEGSVQASGSYTRGGSDNSELTAIVNIPVVREKLAFRVAASLKNKSGWIDQLSTNKENANDLEQSHIRVKGLWQITNRLTLSGTAIKHEADAGAQNLTNIGSVTESNYLLSDHLSFTPSTGSDLDVNSYNLTLEYDLGFAVLVSSSSKTEIVRKRYPHTTFGNTFETFSAGNVDVGKALSQEIRLVGGSDQLEWTLGAYYTELDSESEWEFTDYINRSTDTLLFSLPGFDSIQSQESSAIFGDITYDITDRLAVSFGSRFYKGKTGIFFSTINDSLLSDEFDQVSSKLSLSYMLAEGTKAYVRVAEGFRIGGTNIVPDINLENTKYDPEELLSYEFGIKSSLFDGTLNTDGAIFYTKYDDYQQYDADTARVGFGQIGNVGKVNIKGIDWATTYLVSDHLSLGFSLGYVDSEFAESNAQTFEDGDKVNFIPKYSYSVFAEMTFRWFFAADGAIQIDYSRQGPQTITARNVGYVEPVIESSPLGFLNARVEAKWEGVAVRVFGNNLNNEIRATNVAFPDVSNDHAQSRPRTIGVEFSYDF